MDHFISVSLLASNFECLRVVFAEELHRLMYPSRAHVRAVLNHAPALDELIGSPVLLQTQRSGEDPRLLLGIIMEARLCASPVLDARSRVAPTYEFVIESRLGLAQYIVDCRIFQPTDQSKNTTQDIVTGLLEELGIPVDQQDWQLSESYVPREYCVQYRESTLNFITRLLEDEGISLAIDTAASANNDDPPKTIYRFFDDSKSSPAMPSEAVPLRAASGQNEERSAVYGIDGRRGVAPGQLTLRSFDFTRPTLTLEGKSTGQQFDDLELYGVSQHFVEPSHGKALALVRQGEQESASHATLLTTDSVAIRAGSRFDVGDQTETQNYFVTELRTTYRYSERDRSNQARNYYVAEALVQPLSVPYRPARVHPAPRIYGPQTATIVAKPGTEPEGVETDKYGRVKVHFHWDRYGKFDDTASCWMRVAQLQTSGSMVLPRIDWEVVVEFLDGNPDHPMVSGRLFNGRFMPPYELPAGRTRTSLQSASSPSGGGKNEIRFEDAAGTEELMIHSQYNTVINAANNRKKNITKDETLVVGNNASAEVGGNQTVKVTNGCEHAIKGNQTVTVGGNETKAVNAVNGLTVAGTAATSVSGNWMAMVGSPLDALIALGTAKAAAVASAQADKVFNQVSGAAESVIQQMAAPIQGLVDQASGINNNMGLVADGQLAAASGVIGGAIALPTASDMFRNLASTPALSRTAEGADASSGGIALGGAVQAAVSGALGEAAHAAKNAALGAGSSTDGAAGGGKSEANAAGPAGDLGGFSQADTAKGPGFIQHTISSTHKETIGGNKLAAILESVNYNVAAGMTDDIAAAKIELINGERAESTEAAASETEPALVVVAKGGIVETVNGPRQLTVGGALMETIKGDYSIEGGAMVGLTGATFNVKAKSKITIKCGASSIVIDGSGVTFQTPAFTLTGSQVAAKKSVSDG